MYLVIFCAILIRHDSFTTHSIKLVSGADYSNFGRVSGDALFFLRLRRLAYIHDDVRLFSKHYSLQLYMVHLALYYGKEMSSCDEYYLKKSDNEN